MPGSLEAAASAAERPRLPGELERAFLVGVEFRSRPHPRPRGEQEPVDDSAREPARIPPQALQARSASKTLRLDAEDHAVPFNAEESLAELRELTESAGAIVVGEVLQRRDRPDPATLIGRGKVEEVAAAAKMAGAGVLIFDHELSSSQLRNLEREFDCRVVDRTQLILDIFARHARTREGQLQVELAQLEYMLPRLGGRGAEMSQLGGGIGTRGPGETQLETDRRKIHRRIKHVKEQIEDVRRVRSQQRQRRESIPVPVVALVGYTNAGKSTLFNALTRAGVVESSRMFATLDPTLRTVTLPSRRDVLLSDTVGFIRNLPTTLVSAFRATLEEVQRAAILLQVTDATSPTAAEQMAQVESVLRELDAFDKPQIHVLNKIDLFDDETRLTLKDTPDDVHISAARGLHLDRLLAAVDAHLDLDPVERSHLRVPQSEGKALAQIESRSIVLSRQYGENEMVEFEVDAPRSLLRRLERFIVADGAAMKSTEVKPATAGEKD
ncbi:MAG TPA: GTPase HflX [Candidatus Saccharimonadales bacterium]|nr:GTPase HflX [Candidatus Saccharimonadales bacterium]